MRGGEFISLALLLHQLLFSLVAGGAAKVPPPSPGNFTASVLSLCLLIYPCGKEW